MRLHCNDLVGWTIPEVFCWTRFGVEAGEGTHSIFQRKEYERRKNGGIFLWGIGNSIRPSLLKLLEATASPQVLFSPMRSAPANHDVAPNSVTVWCNATGYDGLPFQMPEYSLVTSRSARPRDGGSHFALVCKCDTSIAAADSSDARLRLAMGSMRNLMSGSVLGSSQVTSVVRYAGDSESPDANYAVAIRAQLVYPFLIRLTGGVEVPEALRLDSATSPSFEVAVDQLIQLRNKHSDVSGAYLEPLFRH